jgi:hypothetical protein
MRNVVLAVIGSQGRVSTSFAAALSRTSYLAKDKDVVIHFDCLEEPISGVSTSIQKNVIANRVLSSPTVDGVFFVHPNISWVPEDFLKLANYDGDNILSGAYVETFVPQETYSISLENILNAEGTEEFPVANFITMAFVYVPKKVLQGLTQFVEQLGEDEDEDKFYVFFKEHIKEGKLQPEDSYFCDMVKSSGFNILVDPTVNCTNNSIAPLRTDYQAYLSKAWIGKMGEDIPQK